MNNMMLWTLKFIDSMYKNGYFAYGVLTVAVCNMFVQIFFDFAFGSRSVLRLGGKR